MPGPCDEHPKKMTVAQAANPGSEVPSEVLKRLHGLSRCIRIIRCNHDCIDRKSIITRSKALLKRSYESLLNSSVTVGCWHSRVTNSNGTSWIVGRLGPVRHESPPPIQSTSARSASLFHPRPASQHPYTHSSRSRRVTAPVELLAALRAVAHSPRTVRLLQVVSRLAHSATDQLSAWEHSLTLGATAQQAVCPCRSVPASGFNFQAPASLSSTR
jgi:hypothetical protein